MAGERRRGDGLRGGGAGGSLGRSGVSISSGSDGHKGLLEPHLDGPGLAIELYPEELRLDSLAVR